MKKFIFSLLTILIFQTVMSQDIKKVRSAYEKKDWTKAKDAVDLYLATEKGTKDWEGWYYKGLIYAQVAKSEGANSESWAQSLEAYKKASQLDAKQVTTFMTVRNYPVFENYQELSKAGTELFNNNDFKGAVAKYKDADLVGRYIFENGWALTELDTVLTYYIGAAAMQAEMTDDAVTYFQKIADKEISGEGFDLCYRYLAYHFDQQGDRVKSDKYVTTGRRLFPEDSYYDKLDLDRERKIGTGPSLFAKYEKVLAKEPEDFEIAYDYAYEMFKWAYYDNQGTPEERAKIFNSIIDQLNKCIKLNTSDIDAYILKGNAYYKEAETLQTSFNKIKGTTATDQDKKKAIKTNMDAYINESIKALEEAVVLFEKRPADDFKNDRRLKNDFKNTMYLLTEAYKFIGNKEKAQYYEKKEQALQ